MRSAPVSPDFAPPLMNFMAEQSYFEEDSDNEGTLAAWATRLHIRSMSSDSPGLSGKKEKHLRSQKSRRNLKSAGEKVKGIFGMKKSPGLV